MTAVPSYDRSLSPRLIYAPTPLPRALPSNCIASAARYKISPSLTSASF
jgi:hypothetical protein